MREVTISSASVDVAVINLINVDLERLFAVNVDPDAATAIIPKVIGISRNVQKLQGFGPRINTLGRILAIRERISHERIFREMSRRIQESDARYDRLAERLGG